MRNSLILGSVAVLVAAIVLLTSDWSRGPDVAATGLQAQLDGGSPSSSLSSHSEAEREGIEPSRVAVQAALEGTSHEHIEDLLTVKVLAPDGFAKKFFGKKVKLRRAGGGGWDEPHVSRILNSDLEVTFEGVEPGQYLPVIEAGDLPKGLAMPATPIPTVSAGVNGESRYEGIDYDGRGRRMHLGIRARVHYPSSYRG